MAVPSNLVRLPITVDHNYVGENSSYFPYQIDISSIFGASQSFKDAVSSAANIAVYDPIADALCDRRVKLDLVNDILLIAFDSGISTSADKLFYICAGPDISESDSINVFLNSGFTNKYGLDENTGSTTQDEVGSNNGTLQGGSIFQPGLFYTGFQPNLDGNINLANISGFIAATKFTIETLIYFNNAGIHYFGSSTSGGGSATDWFYNSITGLGPNYVIWLSLKRAGVLGSVQYSGLGLATGWNHLLFAADLTLGGSGWSVCTNCCLNGSAKSVTGSSGSVPGAVHSQVIPWYLGNPFVPAISYTDANIYDEFLISHSTRKTNAYGTSRSNMLLYPSNFWDVGSLITNLNAEFVGSPRIGESPLVVKFLDLSTGNPVSWLWDFGDGTTSTEQNPTHIFNYGRYTITLTVTNTLSEEKVIKKLNYIESTTESIGDIYYALNSSLIPDIVVFGGDVKRDPGFESAVFISLFTDRKAEESDPLPSENSGKRGLINDVTIGSKLWLLERSKADNELLSRSKMYCEESLKWMVDDGIAESISARTSLLNEKELSIEIDILQKVHGKLSYKYYYNWIAQTSRSA